jgi:hypothetical protein
MQVGGGDDARIGGFAASRERETRAERGMTSQRRQKRWTGGDITMLARLRFCANVRPALVDGMRVVATCPTTTCLALPKVPYVPPPPLSPQRLRQVRDEATKLPSNALSF